MIISYIIYYTKQQFGEFSDKLRLKKRKLLLV